MPLVLFRNFLAFLSLACIVTACSTGIVETSDTEVVDTWDPELEVKRAEAARKKRLEDLAYCEDLLDKPTHVYDAWQGHLKGSRFYTTAKMCPYFFEIGKTYTSDSGGKTRVVKDGDDVIIYQKVLYGDREVTSKRQYKFIQ